MSLLCREVDLLASLKEEISISDSITSNQKVRFPVSCIAEAIAKSALHIPSFSVKTTRLLT